MDFAFNSNSASLDVQSEYKKRARFIPHHAIINTLCHLELGARKPVRRVMLQFTSQASAKTVRRFRRFQLM
jgi:hypothetical protein